MNGETLEALDERKVGPAGLPLPSQTQRSRWHARAVSYGAGRSICSAFHRLFRMDFKKFRATWTACKAGKSSVFHQQELQASLS
jgi:hypothetical protein